MGIAFAVGIPLSVLAYSWLGDQRSAVGFLGFLPIELGILIVCAAPLSLLLRIKVYGEQTSNPAFEEGRRKNAAPLN